MSWVRGASKRLSLYFDHISPAADGREAELETAAVAEFKGWSLQTTANAFLGFAGARLLLSLATGLVIDRFGALKLASLYPLPLAAGLLALLFMEHQSAAGIYLFLAGCSQGMASPILTALWAELYGVDNLGAIKGMVSSFGVFSTALGPLLFGWLLAGGVSIGFLAIGTVIGLVLSSALAVFPRWRPFISELREQEAA